MISLFTKVSGTGSLGAFVLCIGCALVLGIAASVIYNSGTHHTASFSLALALLPSVVTLIILLVQTSIAAGLGIAGSLTLVRFRSAPGTAREMTGAFISVALGLGCGMGYLGFTVLFFIIIALTVTALRALHFGEHSMTRQLKITVPEDLDYDNAFDEVLDCYTSGWELVKVRTTNMGTLCELTYDVTLPEGKMSKQFLDDLRCLNGNLNIVCGRESDRESL